MPNYKEIATVFLALFFVFCLVSNGNIIAGPSPLCPLVGLYSFLFDWRWG
jgi:hypothetical protein